MGHGRLSKGGRQVWYFISSTLSNTGRTGIFINSCNKIGHSIDYRRSEPGNKNSGTVKFIPGGSTFFIP